MSWQSAQSQIKRFSRLLDDQNVEIKEFSEHPRHLLSLSSQLTLLKTVEKRKETQIEAPTSGESSPCVSDSEKKSRFIAPSVFDVHENMNEDNFSDIDYNIEKVAENLQKKTSLLIEGLDPSMTIDEFMGLMSEVKIYHYTVNCIFDTRKHKFITYKNKHCLLLQIQIKYPIYFPKYIRKLQMHVKNSAGIRIGVSMTKKSQKFNGVILRGLPPKITYEELSEQCIQEVGSDIVVKPIQRIKQAQCCEIECKYLEDAEIICKKINKIQLRDTLTQESYLIKAHVYPFNTLRHLKKEKSIFSETLSLKKKPNPIQKCNKSKRTDIKKIIDIFANTINPVENQITLNDVTNKELSTSKKTSDSLHVQETRLKPLKNHMCITSYI